MSKLRLGVFKKENGAEFRVFSEHAENMDLCLFSEDEQTEVKIPLTRGEDNVWSAFVPGVKENQKYGYRAHGKFAPEEGLYFRPEKLLVDPYAKDLTTSVTTWESTAIHLDNTEDSAHFVPKSIVTFEDKAADQKKYPYLHKKPHIPWEKTAIMELHTKGFTIRHPDLPQEIRGKFSALAHPEIIQYLKALNINHVELLPVTTTCGGPQLKQEYGLSDYWGYNPINHFALDKRFGSRDDFKQMVNNLHKNGIGVILDLVYNHTGEFGATHNLLSYKGLDAPNYYRMTPNHDLINTTGCGNSFNPNTPVGRQLVEDSLTYFATEMGIDGFRFDLAGDCALDANHRFNPNGEFMTLIRDISQKLDVKISGEPWSAVGGYFRGQMNGMFEWSDRNEETLRRFYRGDEYVIQELAGHLTGSNDVHNGEQQSTGVHYVAKHDGFPAFDSVHYNFKNNWQNNENNNDGNSNEICSASPDDNIAYRRIKSLLAANVLSRGVPLLMAGDELGRTQGGNNNAYCQDNELTWVNWQHFTPKQRDLYLFTRKLLALRADHPTFSSLDTFTGQVVPSNNRKDIEWIRADGQEMQTADWQNPANHILAYVLNGNGAEVSQNKNSQSNRDDDFMVLLCGNTYGFVDFTLPTPPNQKQWELVFDTTGKHKKINDNNTYTLEPYSCVVLTSKQQEKSRTLSKEQRAVLNNKQR
jgi:glycogen operon protein